MFTLERLLLGLVSRAWAIMDLHNFLISVALTDSLISSSRSFQSGFQGYSFGPLLLSNVFDPHWGLNVKLDIKGPAMGNHPSLPLKGEIRVSRKPALKCCILNPKKTKPIDLEETHNG